MTTIKLYRFFYRFFCSVLSVIGILFISFTNSYGQSISATISGTTSVNVGDQFPLVTFTGNNGVAPYIFTYNINGGSNLTVTSSTTSGNPTPGNKKLIFIHHSTGGQMLADNYGGLGRLLMNAGYYVSDVCYGWSVSGYGDIGSYTDIGNWYTWFASSNTNRIMSAVYARDGKDQTYGTYTRSSSNPGGENEIVVFKSCFPNSEIYPNNSNYGPSSIYGRQRDSQPRAYTEDNVRALYNTILPYFQAHPEKMFVVITAPSKSSYEYSGNGDRARSFNNWLVNEWLQDADYVNKNVYVWDYFNVLTNANNHHYVVNGEVVHTTVSGSGNSTISSYHANGDEHANPTASNKGASEFTQCLNVWYDVWRSWLAGPVADGNTATVNVPTNNSGTFVYRLLNVSDNAGHSASASGTATITVNEVHPLPTSVISGTTSICAGGSATLSISFTGTAPFVYRITGDNTDRTSTTTSATVHVSPSSSTTYYVTQLHDAYETATASGRTGNAAITVNANNTITLTSSSSSTHQTPCLGASITNITYRTTGATGASFAGLPSGVNGRWSNGTVTISGTPTVSGTYNYTVTMTGGCDGGTNYAAGTITVNPNNTISLTSASSTTTQSLCIGNAITNISYRTTGATGASFTGLPTGVTGTWNDGAITISGTPTVSGTFNYTVTMTGGCTGGTNTASGRIVVNPNNSMSLTSSTTTTNQHVCIGTPIANISYVTIGATGASFAGLPLGVNGTWNNGAVTISGTPTVSGTYNYTVTLTGGCVGETNSATGTIIVNPNNTVTLSSASSTITQTLCLGNVIEDITYATTGAIGASFAGLPTGVTGIWNNGIVTISGTPTVTGTFNYTVTLIGGCTGATNTATGTIVVIPNSTIVLSNVSGPRNQSICLNSPIYDIVFSTAAATDATVTGLPTGVTSSWNNGIITISGTPTVSGTFNYTVTLIGNCGVDENTVTGTIVINPLPSATISGTTTVCQNSNRPVITFTGSGASVPYTFTYTINGGSYHTVTSNGTSSTATVYAETNTGGSFVYTLVSVTSGTGCSTLVGRTATVNVTPSNVISLASASGTNNQSICYNSSITNIVYTTTGATGATFSGLPAGVTGVWNNGTVTISGTPTVTGTFNYTVYMTGGCGTGVNSASGTIVVKALPNANIRNVSAICAGSTATLSASGGTSYAWYAGTSATGTLLSNSSSYTTSELSSSSYYTVRVTNNGCESTATAVVPVNQRPTSVISGTTAICENEDAAITIRFTGASPFTYALDADTYTTSQTSVSIPVSPSHTYTYAVTSLSDANCVSLPADRTGSAVVTVNQLPTASISGITTVPVGNSTTLTASGGVTYAWYAGDVASGNVLSTSAQYVTPEYNSAGIYTYTVSVTNASGCMSTASVNVEATVNLMASLSGSATVLQNDPSPILYFTGINGTAPYTFTYNVNNGADRIVTSSSPSNVATVAVPTNEVGTFVYTLTNVDDNDGNRGDVNVSATVIVDYVPMVGSVAGGTTVCMGSDAPAISFSVTNGTAPYTFYYTLNGTPYSVTAQSGNTATVMASTTQPGEYIYRLVEVRDANRTQDVSGSATVVVNSLPSAVIAGITSICQGDNTTLSASGGVTYAWYQGATATGNVLATTAEYVTPVLSANTQYTVLVTNGNGCSSTATCTVTVNDIPEVSITGNTSICYGGSLILNATGGESYAWYEGTVASGTVLSTSSRLIQSDITRNTSYTVMATNASGCWTVETVSVTVNALPVASISGTTSVCYGSSATLTASGGATYEWYRGSNAIGNIVSTSATYTTPALTANTSFTVRVTSASGCQSTYTHEVTINPLPTVSITGNSVVMDGNSTTLTAFGGVSYEWYAGSMASGTPIAYTAQLSTPDLHYNTHYTVLVTDILGCAASATQLVQVTDRLSASISGTTTVTQGDASPFITFKAVSGLSPYTFAYNINGGETMTVSTAVGNDEVSVTVPTENAGTYVYNLLSVTDNNNFVEELSASATVTVRSLLFDVSITGETSVCVGDEAPTVVFSINNGVYPFTFYYKVNGGETNSVTTHTNRVSIKMSTDEAGMFEYRIIGVEDSRMTQALDKSTVVTVYEVPVVSVTGETLVEAGQTTTLFAEGGSIISWYAGQTPTGEVLATTSSFITPVINSDTYFTAVVSNAVGCSSVCTVRVSVITTGVEDITIEEATIYPNPASSYFIVGLPSIMPYDAYVEIFDISGRKLYQEMIDGRQEVRISVDNYKEGIYLIRVRSQFASETKKLIIKR